MTIPKLKRIKIMSEAELSVWLTKNNEHSESVMLMLFDKSSGTKFVAPELIDEILRENGWQSGRRYTMNGNMIGHVISPLN